MQKGKIWVRDTTKSKIETRLVEEVLNKFTKPPPPPPRPGCFAVGWLRIAIHLGRRGRDSIKSSANHDAPSAAKY